MDNTFRERINAIKTIYPGTFQIILDFASNKFIEYILRPSHKYIWIHNYSPHTSKTWTTFDMPLSDKLKTKVLTRQVTYDSIIPTEDYKEIKDEMPNGTTLIQINKLPPDFLDLRSIKGRTRHELLKKECDYLFEIDIPGAVDYGTLVSHDETYLRSLLADKTINWEDLP
jgi:hypothetical protein